MDMASRILTTTMEEMLTSRYVSQRMLSKLCCLSSIPSNFHNNLFVDSLRDMALSTGAQAALCLEVQASHRHTLWTQRKTSKRVDHKVLAPRTGLPC